MLNALFEVRLLKLIGYLQIAMTAVMVVILIVPERPSRKRRLVESCRIFSTGQAGGNWPLALIVNTGYLYLLFFGFQEIQALEHDALEFSSIPMVSWFKKGFRMSKFQYLGYAMVGSVLIASVINILYGLAVFTSTRVIPS